MSIKTVTRWIVVCDSCGAVHPGAEKTGAMAARIQAGIDNWQYRGSGGGYGGRGQRSFDWCPNCPEPSAPPSTRDK